MFELKNLWNKGSQIWRCILISMILALFIGGCGPQSLEDQSASIAKALVDAINTSNPEVFAQYAIPYYHDDLLELFKANVLENINFKLSGIGPQYVWKEGTVKLVGYYLEEVPMYDNLYDLRVKLSGVYLGKEQIVEYWLRAAKQDGRLLVQWIAY